MKTLLRCKRGLIPLQAVKTPLKCHSYAVVNFCDLNHEVKRKQQEEKHQHQRAEVNFMLMREYKIIKNFRLSKLMIVFQQAASQRVGERHYASSSQPACCFNTYIFVRTPEQR